jgi:hypothetical protein
MTTAFGDKLKEALENKANDINSYVWKYPKIKGVQKELKLVDATYEQLRKFYEHCNEMLYNKDSKNPGRLTLLEIVNDQILRCRAELLIRWLRAERQYTNTKCLESIKVIINNNKDTLTNETIKTYPIETIMSGLPLEFNEIPISLVMDACLDSLGVFDSSHISLNFITKMGFWFTQQEMQKELYEKDPETGKAVNRLDLVRREFKIDPEIFLFINDKGLSYKEFKSMFMLKKDKYSNLTSDQLRLISNKIIYLFKNRCEDQEKQLSDKIKEIKEIAELKGWDVTRAI